LLPTRVSEVGGAVEHIPVEVSIPRGEPNRVLAQEPPSGLVVISRAVVILPRLAIPLSAGVAEAEGDACITLPNNITVTVVVDLVQQHSGTIGNLPYAALVVGEQPAGLVTGVFGEDLVYLWTMEVALFEGVVAVKNEGDVFPVVNIALGADTPCC
jgi:hypothetical protein